MWLSKKLSQNTLKSNDTGAQMGNLTISSSSVVAACASSEIRGISFYAPPGIQFLPAEGKNVLLIPCDSKTACVGVLMEKDTSLAPGELKLFSSGGASIVLKNNGEIILNDRVQIFRNGNVKVHGTVNAYEFVSDS